MNYDDMTETYLDFVAERHRIWEKRQAGEPGPWTEDPVLRGTKFTNVFRVLDPGSQFLLKMMDEPGLDPADALARAILYRYTNHPRVWEHSRKVLGHYPILDDMDDTLADIWCRWRDDEGLRVFSGAYIIMPRPGVKGADKVRDAVALAYRVTESIRARFVDADMTVEDRYRLLASQDGVGKFMAMQITTDYGYSRHGQHDEDEFVVAGPGARLGTAFLKMDMKPEEVIRRAQRAVHLNGGVALALPNGKHRRPSLMDIQNTFCEFGKYVRRYEKRQGFGKEYRPEHPGVQVPPVFPAHWT